MSVLGGFGSCICLQQAEQDDLQFVDAQPFACRVPAAAAAAVSHSNCEASNCVHVHIDIFVTLHMLRLRLSGGLLAVQFLLQGAATSERQPYITLRTKTRTTKSRYTIAMHVYQDCADLVLALPGYACISDTH